MNRTLNISSHDELLSYVPHALGFRRPEGMVCVPLGGGPISRLDLPATARDREPLLSTLADVYLHRHPARHIALIAYGENGLACLEALADLSERLVEAPKGPDVGPMLWVKGDEWFDVLGRTSGTIDPGVRARFDAEFALQGRVMPVERRGDIAAAMQGDPAGVAEHLTAADERAMVMDTSARVAEVAWLGSTLEGFLQDRNYLPDPEAARVLAILYGPDYGPVGTLLPILVAGTIPFAVTTTLLTTARIREDSSATISMAVALAACVLIPTALLTAHNDALGAAWGWAPARWPSSRRASPSAWPSVSAPRTRPRR